MSDNHRCYRAIHEALTQCYPGEISGRMAQHLTVLAAFISDIVGSKSGQLPSIATKISDRAQPESRVKRLTRWLKNDEVKEAIYFLPYAAMLLQCLALETLVLVMDGSGLGRGCSVLMLHAVYKGRALPLAWIVRQCPKGHAPESLHIQLVDLVKDLIPEGTRVVFLGDGEFDGTDLQETMNDAGWLYACRTAKSTVEKLAQCGGRCQTNLKTHKVAHVVLFSSNLELSYDLVIDYCRLRCQIEFNFRDAKQHWGLEDFMVVNERPVYNSENLALFMVNVSQALMRPMRAQWPELSVNDLKPWFRSRKYVVETLKLLPEMPEAIFIDQAIAQIAQLGRINPAVNPV